VDHARPWRPTSPKAWSYAKHILLTKPTPRIAILSQNDDFGRDYVAGFKRALGERPRP